MNNSAGKKVKAEMMGALEAHAKNNTGRTGKITSAKVKRYMMTNVDNVLRTLMDNKIYRKAVLDMLKKPKTSTGPLRLVTGMLTCKDTIVQWDSEGGRNVGGSGRVTGETIGVPGADGELSAEHTSLASQSTGQRIKDEVVFALAYDQVKLQKYLEWHSIPIPWKPAEGVLRLGRQEYGEGPRVFGQAPTIEATAGEDESEFELCSLSEAI